MKKTYTVLLRITAPHSCQGVNAYVHLLEFRNQNRLYRYVTRLYRYVTRTNVPFFDLNTRLGLRSKNETFVRET